MNDRERESAKKRMFYAAYSIENFVTTLLSKADYLANIFGQKKKLELSDIFNIFSKRKTIIILQKYLKLKGHPYRKKKGLYIFTYKLN